MAEPMTDEKYFVDVFGKLQDDASRDGDSAKLQDLCKQYWKHLDTLRTSPSLSDTLDSFVNILLDQQSYDLAKLVIPRGHQHSQSLHPHKQELLRRLEHRRSAAEVNETTTLSSNDHPLYIEEKLIFTQAEMYRAGLLLYGRGNLTKEEKTALEAWWKLRPQTAWQKVYGRELESQDGIESEKEAGSRTESDHTNDQSNTRGETSEPFHVQSSEDAGRPAQVLPHEGKKRGKKRQREPFN